MNGQLIPGGLPTNCYPSSPQQLYNLMFQLGVVQFPNLTGIVISDSQPAAVDRDKAWVKTSAGAPLWPPFFIWFNGAWILPHPVPPGSSEKRLWEGLEADLVTYDGGDGGAAGQASGPMWQVDHNWDGRTPMGPGAVPNSTPAISVTVGQNLGEAQHANLLTEIPYHGHNMAPLGTELDPTAKWVNIASFQAGTDWSSNSSAGSGNLLAKAFKYEGGDPNSTPTPNATVGHNNIQPCRGLFLIIRTGRLYYRGS